MRGLQNNENGRMASQAGLKPDAGVDLPVHSTKQRRRHRGSIFFWLINANAAWMLDEPDFWVELLQVEGTGQSFPGWRGRPFDNCIGCSSDVSQWYQSAVAEGQATGEQTAECQATTARLGRCPNHLRCHLRRKARLKGWVTIRDGGVARRRSISGTPRLHLNAERPGAWQGVCV